MQDYTVKNADTIDRWIEEGWEWGVPVSADVCDRARHGEWEIALTPASL